MAVTFWNLAPYSLLDNGTNLAEEHAACIIALKTGPICTSRRPLLAAYVSSFLALDYSWTLKTEAAYDGNLLEVYTASCP
jgi:hypothetical protein